MSALAKVPKISGKSPLAEGFTVNIMDINSEPGNAREWTQEKLEAVNNGTPWHLRVWLKGEPIESSYHQTPSKAAMRLGALVMDGTVGAQLRSTAKQAAAELFANAMGGFGGDE